MAFPRKPFTRTLLTFAAVGLCLLAFSADASAARRETSTSAPDFPPGAFSDGGRYKLADFKGKVLVLFFYEADCPRCRGTIPERNKVVEQFKGKPVKFIAVGPADTLGEVRAYVRGTGLAMPTFADTLGAMQKAYGFTISLNNIYQTRIIGPNGSIVGMDMDAGSIERALANVKWKYKDDGYNAKLSPAIECFEWNQWEAGMKLLKPHRASSDKAVKESAEKLYEAVKAEALEWKKEADAEAEKSPAGVMDTYAKLAVMFEGEELGKECLATVAKLKEKPEVKDEIAARGMWAKVEAVAGGVTKASQKAEVAGFCKEIAKKYPETPTGKKAENYAKNLEAGKGG